MRVLLGRPVVVKWAAYPEWAGRIGIVERVLVGTNPQAPGPWLVCKMIEPAETLVFSRREVELL